MCIYVCIMCIYILICVHMCIFACSYVYMCMLCVLYLASYCILIDIFYYQQTLSWSSKGSPFAKYNITMVFQE